MSMRWVNLACSDIQSLGLSHCATLLEVLASTPPVAPLKALFCSLPAFGSQTQHLLN